ncbi:trypsin-like peptidase domain-containing protein [Lachnospiraceae bacterium 45-W7]
MDNKFNEYSNFENERSNMEQGRNSADAASGSQEHTESVNSGTETSSTGAPGPVYSYSYVHQENTERNPNYFEKKEEENAASQRTYTTGSYGNPQMENQAYTGSQANAENQAYAEAQGYAGSQAYTQERSSNGEQPRQNFYKTPESSVKKEKKKQKVSGMKKQHGFGMTIAKCAAVAVVFGLVSSTVFYGTGIAFEHTTGKNRTAAVTTDHDSSGSSINNGSLSTTNVSTATTVTDVSDIVENVMPSIVSITNMGQIEADFFGRTFQQDTSSAGSGIIIGQTDEEIYVATNNHVVANSNQLTVNFIDDQQVTAEIKGTDASTDLAVLSVKVKDIPSDTMEKIKVATLGKSDDIRVGESVVAIGNALGYGQSVTTGVISALNREVTVQDETTGASITNKLLQTDAAINPGNSGGALLNMNGEVIGINSVKYSDTQVEGMGYSIPISAAQPIIDSLITRELVDESNSSFLGVAGQDVTTELSKSFGMPEGLYITMVTENSAAEQAGIQKGDVLTKFDDRAVKSQEGLQDIMQYYAAGTQVEVTLQTNENGEWKEKVVTVTLGRRNQ